MEGKPQRGSYPQKALTFYRFIVKYFLFLNLYGNENPTRLFPQVSEKKSSILLKWKKASMEEVEERTKPVKRRIKKAGFYAALFLSGILISAFAREGLDAIRQTANIAAQTASEAWAPNSNFKPIAKIPLKANNKAAASLSNPQKSKVVTTRATAALPQTKKEASPPVPSSNLTPNSTAGQAVPSSSSQISENQSVSVSVPASPVSVAPPSSPLPPVPSSSPAVVAGLNHLVIVEIQISGGAGNSENDFIKFGNPTSGSIDLSGWKIRKRTKTGTESSVRVIPDGISVPAGGTIIWANNKIATQVGAQITSSATIAADNSIAILDPSGVPVDAVAWGGGSGQFAEGPPYSANPDGGQILKRKISGGTWQDTENNSADLFI